MAAALSVYITAVESYLALVTALISKQERNALDFVTELRRESLITVPTTLAARSTSERQLR